MTEGAGLPGLLAEGVDRGVAPAMSLLLWKNGQPAGAHAAGAATGQTAFDLASLTKPLATAVISLRYAASDHLPWDTALGDFLGQAVPEDKRPITVRQLLTHAAGFPAYQPYFQAMEKLPPQSRPGLLKSMIMNEPLAHAPGEKALYSDLGYLLLGLIVAEGTESSLDRVLAEVYAQMGLENGPRYLPAGQAAPWPLEGIAPCGPLPGRPLIHGQVEDENAFTLGGVAGHAGLFGAARQVAEVMDSLCRLAAGQGPWPAEMARALFTPDEQTPASPRTIGFDTPTGPLSAAGDNPPAGVVGHTGFTGVSLWWQPRENSGVVLLTNRVAHGRDNWKIKAFRNQLHNLAWKELGF